MRDDVNRCLEDIVKLDKKIQEARSSSNEDIELCKQRAEAKLDSLRQMEKQIAIDATKTKEEIIASAQKDCEYQDKKLNEVLEVLDAKFDSVRQTVADEIYQSLFLR